MTCRAWQYQHTMIPVWCDFWEPPHHKVTIRRCCSVLFCAILWLGQSSMEVTSHPGAQPTRTWAGAGSPDQALINSRENTAIMLAGIILCMRPANGRWCYNVMSSSSHWLGACTKWSLCWALLRKADWAMSSRRQQMAWQQIGARPSATTMLTQL